VKPKLLLDTHVLIRWVLDSGRLSREQLRLLRNADRNGEPVGISAISLLEMAQLSHRGLVEFVQGVETVFEMLETSPALKIFPLTVGIAREAPPLSAVLRDPADCLIVATARVHGLRLLTSDRRIVDSKLAQIVD
jgi:PIN domain nuclease of toxin-antitoxin system